MNASTAARIGQSSAPPPQAIQKNGTWYTYGLNLTKKVCEVFCSSDYIGTAYTYSPFGEITVSWLIFVFAIDDALLIEGV